MTSKTRSAFVRIGAIVASAAFLLPPSAIAQQHSPRKMLTAQELTLLQQSTPFQNNNGQVPSKAEYDGPLFQLSHAWPAPSSPLRNAPWQAAIGNGPITVHNAPAYANALKAAVAANARTLIYDYANWDAGKAGWYNEPWAGPLREAIRGTYPAGEFGPGVFPGTKLAATFRTHVLTYYDARAAASLGAVWGSTELSAMAPNVTTSNTQFTEGSIIVKAAAFASVDPTMPTGWWPVLNGAQQWKLYLRPEPPDPKTQPKPPKPANPQVQPAYVMQFDIIVKDSQSSPKTGWVFMTLVYDSRAPGDAWAKMVPLGVQWGNDPQAKTRRAPLFENWINPAAPFYAKQTLGWGGRLSGPNDGGRSNIVINGKVVNNAPNSGCMSCHSTAQWNVAQHKMPSFLLPSTPPNISCDQNGKPEQGGDFICSPPVASPAWMKWFQNRRGSTPMDAGAVATDFDLVLSFKSLPLWWAAVGKTDPTTQPDLLRLAPHTRNFNHYTGAPLPPRK